MEIREAHPDDAEAIHRVHRASIEGLGPEAYTQKQVDAWARGCESADYRASITADDLYFVVAAADNDILGFGSLSLQSPSDYQVAVDIEITGIYVHPSVAREGVGTDILTVLEREARTRGAETVGLTASRNAVPFYEHHGYTRVRACSHEFSSHESTGVEGEVVEMRTELDNC